MLCKIAHVWGGSHAGIVYILVCSTGVGYTVSYPYRVTCYTALHTSARPIPEALLME